MVCSFFLPRSFWCGAPKAKRAAPQAKGCILGGDQRSVWGSQESRSPQCRQGAAVVRVSQRRTEGRRGRGSTPFSITRRDRRGSAPAGETNKVRCLQNHAFGEGAAAPSVKARTPRK